MIFAFIFPFTVTAGNLKIIRDADGIPLLTSENAPFPFGAKVQDSKKKLMPLVEEISAQLSIDPSLVSAVITQESGWRRYARSSKGALGLMQLMPRTALNWGVRDAYDPRENITAGSRHLLYLLDLFDRNLPLALAAYHAGEGLVLREGTIPSIKETQNYVKAVQQTYDELAKVRLEKLSRLGAN